VDIIYLIFIFTFGLIIGSFLSALSYRIPNGISVLKGRSFCPECKNKISWYDNVPLFSFILLKARCRHCEKKISYKYPLIELSTAIMFLLIYLLNLGCSINHALLPSSYVFCTWKLNMGFFTLPYFLLISAVLVVIFFIDLEEQIIPDELVFLLISLTFVVIFLSFNDFYTRIFSGLLVSMIFLLIHHFTKGKGMGLGDVKFVFFGGMLLNLKMLFTWIFLSSLIGSLIGIVLMLFGKTKFGKQIPFGPFLIIGLFLTILLGDIFSLPFLM